MFEFQALSKSILSSPIPLFIYICFKRYKYIVEHPVDRFCKSTKSIEYDYDIIKLANGYCHYRTNIINPFILHLDKIYNKTNPTYIFIHDNYGSLYDFSNIIQELYEDNYININKKHYLVYDLYGRGYSQYYQYPPPQQTLQLYILQLIELLYKLNITGKLHIIGIGMGTAIASGFASIHPEKIRSLILLSPIGFKNIANKELQNNYNHYKNVNMWNNFKSIQYKKYNDFYDNIYSNIDLKLSNVNFLPIREIKENYEKINKLIKHILIIWPENDKFNPIDNIKHIITTITNSEIQIKKNNKHLFLIEHGDEIYDSINKWINNKNREEVRRNNLIRKETFELRIL